ncbi:hypothetical protein H5869_29075 [Klebsiella pneumoniae]|nr:hypothetical protein [Klebsiella pneumoniae]MCB3224614.1 hypothetical protein [Klebsiella pneumoniae]MCB3230223.1 hypothetical protein [Klebsiella pneumoniae]
MPAFEWVHVQLHQQKGMISLSPPTICNSAKTFTTPEFYYRGGRAEFYQDPQDPMKKHAIIGLTFNAPADVKNLESRLSMTRDGKPVPYTVTVMNCCHLC